VPYGSSLEHLRDERARIDILVRGQVARARQAASDEVRRWRTAVAGSAAGALAIRETRATSLSASCAVTRRG